jgi:hypothetical protein
MDDEEKEMIGKTFVDILTSIDILIESMINLKERTERLETVVIQIAKIQGADGKIVHKN